MTALRNFFSHDIYQLHTSCFCPLQWAEVLSADAFSAFEDAGLENDKVC